jgi:hypothetical protein
LSRRRTALENVNDVDVKGRQSDVACVRRSGQLHGGDGKAQSSEPIAPSRIPFALGPFDLGSRRERDFTAKRDLCRPSSFAKANLVVAREAAVLEGSDDKLPLTVD